MPPIRKITKKIDVSGVTIGGGSPIVIQSMTNTKTADIEATSRQINELAEAGCALVRCSVPDMESAEALAKIKKRVKIPIAADIHFDYRLAIAAIENGADKLRINPGNIGGAERVRAVADKAREYGVPIRVGVNSGSVERRLLEKYGGPTAEAIAESALDGVKLLEGYGFSEIVVSVKSSDVPLTVLCYELLSEKTDYPLHVGVTEAGTVWAGGVKSAVGIGSVLMRGIGDTIRVSLTGDPAPEIKWARQILKSLGYKGMGPEIIACPTCARTGMDVQRIAEELETRLAGASSDIKIAVMGCAVNGPGEAREADIGVAAGNGEAVLFRKGEIVGKLREDEVLDRLLALIGESE